MASHVNRPPHRFAQGLAVTRPHAIGGRMADASHPAIERIERAVKRIETAAQARAYAADRIARKHAALKERIEAAVASLDVLIARENGGE
jgi:hypothetical protein